MTHNSHTSEETRAHARRIRERFDEKLDSIPDDVMAGLRSELRHHAPALRFNETLWVIYHNRTALMGYDVTAAALKLPAAFVDACRVALSMPEL